MICKRWTTTLRTFCMLGGILILASCVPVGDTSILPEKDYRPLDTLTQLNDLNESVFKYVTNCANPPAKPTSAFVKNYEYVLNRLFDEKIKTEGFTPKQASNEIMKRRFALQNYLDKSFKQDGCNGVLADRAAQHYKHFSNFTPKNIDRLVKEGMATPRLYP
jgi:hypothetical protein